MRITKHPILGSEKDPQKVYIYVDGEKIEAKAGEPIASAILASGRRIFRFTPNYNRPRGVYCAIGRCTDCVMTVNGVPNVRTCVEVVEEGMEIETQVGSGNWGDSS